MPAKTTNAVLSVCWDRSRFYFVIAKISKKKTTIVTAKSGSWKANFDAAEAAERITEELARHKIRKPSLVVGVARAQVDMCTVTLPPAADAEVPQMVRNEVTRQFGELPDAAIIDFDLEVADGNKVAHAFVLRPDTHHDISAFAKSVDLQVDAILPRHYSVASLFGRVIDGDHNSGLLLNMLEDSADLLVVHETKISTNRTIHYGKDSGSVQVERLTGEILRTVAANPAMNAINEVFVFGREVAATELATAMKDSLPYSVTVLDPLKDTEHSGIRGDDPSFPMAALVGMVRDVQADSALVDFANPKRPPAPPNRWKKTLFYVAAAAAAIGIICYTYGKDLADLDAKIGQLQEELDKEEKLFEKLQSKTVIVDAVQSWENQSTNWLDEIRDLSLRFPPEGDAIVDRMSCSQNQYGGSISMGVRVREPSIVNQMETSLRDSYRAMRSKRISQIDQGQAFPCQFETTFSLVQRRPREAYLQRYESTQQQDNHQTSELSAANTDLSGKEAKR
ncbi:MAG: hypothetical protein KDB27_15005 [Planctomycetales bacterium]|nr:hypothetical protein [Planctomycetales bacterium]